MSWPVNIRLEGITWLLVPLTVAEGKVVLWEAGLLDTGVGND